MDTGEWYLEVNGKKVGPFTLEQIHGLLDDGEIRAYHQVTSVVTGGQWITVEEALRNANHAPPSELPQIAMPVEATAVTAPVSPPIAMPASVQTAGGFNPPPRPEIAPAPIVVDDQNDPATSIFDALQLEKERRTTIGPYRGRTSRKSLFRVRKVAEKFAAVKQVKIIVPLTPRMFWTAVFAGLVLGTLTFGVMRYFKHHSPPPSGVLTPLTPASAPHAQPTIAAPLIPRVTPAPHPTVTAPQGRVIPPPPPPAHMVVPQQQYTPPNGAENGEGFRERQREMRERQRERMQQRQYNNGNPQEPDNAYPNQDNGYPPGDSNNGENPSGQYDRNSGQYPPQNPNNPNYPDSGEQNGGAQYPQDGNGQDNAPGRDQFQPLQNNRPQGDQNPGQNQGQYPDQNYGQ